MLQVQCADCSAILRCISSFRCADERVVNGLAVGLPAFPRRFNKIQNVLLIVISVLKSYSRHVSQEQTFTVNGWMSFHNMRIYPFTYIEENLLFVIHMV